MHSKCFEDISKNIEKKITYKLSKFSLVTGSPSLGISNVGGPVKGENKNMTISVTLPSGKELLFTKGQGGVIKLFTTNNGEVVVCTKTSVNKFGNMPFHVEHERDEDKDIEA